MLSAKTKAGKYVTLARLSKTTIRQIRREEKFYCPSCRQPVIVKAGTMMIPHFAHKKASICGNQTGGESDYHYKGKLLLYEWLLDQHIDVTLEEYIPSIQQRPDLLLRIRGRLIAIEYQTATIDRKIIDERNQGYNRANVIPIWILGANQLTRLRSHHFKINSFSLAFLHRFSASYPTMLFYLCPQKKQFSFLHDVFMIDKRKALARQTYLPLSQSSFQDFFQCTFFSKETLHSLWQKEKKSFRLRPRTRHWPSRAWRNWLYEKKLHIDYLPAHIFLPIRSQYKMSVPLWEWQSRFLLDFFQKLEKGSIFSVQHAEHFLQRYMIRKMDTPLIRVKARPVLEYILLLQKAGIVDGVGNGQFRKIGMSKKYRHIEQALNGDDEFLHYFMYNRLQMDIE